MTILYTVVHVLGMQGKRWKDKKVQAAIYAAITIPSESYRADLLSCVAVCKIQ